MLPTSRRDFAGYQPSIGAGTRFGQLSKNPFFARHNPQPKRVRHIRGLLDWPICAVNDDFIHLHKPLSVPSSPERRLYHYRIPRLFHPSHHTFTENTILKSQSYPINTITGLSTYPLGFKNMEGKNPKFIPVTDAWRDELKCLTDRAGLGLPEDIREKLREQPKRTSVYSADTGRLIPPPSRAMSRGASRQRNREAFLHIAPEPDNQVMVMEMLCQILQIDSMAAVQSWLVSAPENEKELVLNIIRSALTHEEQYYPKPEAVNNEPPMRDSPLMTHPPSNMNLQNGYGELERPTLRSSEGNLPRLGTATNYSRYMYEQSGERSKVNSAGGPMQAMFDEEDHPALRQGSHKPDVFKVDHSPRQSPKPGTHPSARPLTQQSIEQAAISPNHILRMSSPRHSPRLSADYATHRQSLMSSSSRTQAWRPEEALVA